MKPSHTILVLASILALPGFALAEDILLNLAETPDRVGTYYMADKQNSGEVTSPQQITNIIPINENGWPMKVGDWSANEGVEGYMVKYFLLFHLPALEGKKLERATLRLFLFQVGHEASDKLPPAWLVHAKEWPDEDWTADPSLHGLQYLHFSDKETFSKKLPLSDPESVVGKFIELDVTKMILSDYKRKGEPVAAFRLEVGDPETLDISDQLSNSYTFGGTGMEAPKTLPTLILSAD